MIENNSNTQLSGKAAFNIFLNVIEDVDLMFIKHDFYNVGEYSYFFTTEKINDNNNIIKLLEKKRSLRHAFLTLKEIKNMRLSFYFGIKRKTFFYGFYNEDTQYVYKVGSFKTISSYVRKIKSRSLTNITHMLYDVDLMKSNILHNIKKDYENFFDVVPVDIKIKDQYILSKQYDRDIFNIEDITEQNMNYTLLLWTRKYKWFGNVYSFVNITDKYIYFYLKLKI